jgi:precorrin-4/cobalt-precorrin-4 C11-methyltransferase
MSLDAIIDAIKAAHDKGLDVARLHSGDVSIWSAMGEQLKRLRDLGIPYDVTPGVPSFAASAAALGVELTLPGLAQSVILTRTSGRASAMPKGETLAAFAATGATLAIHLSVHALSQVVSELVAFYGQDCPVAVVWRATWPDQRIVRGTLETIVAAVGPEIDRTALILVGHALAAEGFDESRLYADDYDRRYRPRGTDPRFPE